MTNAYGEQLRAIRVIADIPQGRLASRIGCSAGLLSEIEQGKRPMTKAGYRETMALLMALIKERDAMTRTVLKQGAA